MGGTQNVSFLGRRYFKLPILSCPRIPPATQASFEGHFWNEKGTKKIGREGKINAIIIQRPLRPTHG